jgi:hypothetical protein
MVDPEIIRLPLTNEDFLDVKKALTAGEREDMFGEIAPLMTAGEKLHMQTSLVRMKRVLAYLLTWSFVGNDGKPIPMSPDLPENARLAALRSISTEAFDEVFEAIMAHEVTQGQALETAKNGSGGVSVVAPTSPSVN